MYRPAFAVMVGLAVGCNGGTEYLSSDVRLDKAGPNDEVDSLAPQMCVDPNGRVYVVWYDDRNGVPTVWFQRSTDGGRSWMPGVKRVSHGGKAAVNPSIGCTAEAVYVAWEDARDGELENHNIYLNRSLDGGDSWQGDDLLLDDDPEGSTMSLGPQVAAVGEHVHVAWYDSANGAYDIYTSSSSDSGDTFALPVRVDSDSAGQAFSASPQVLAQADHVYVTWEDSRDGNSDVYFAMSSDGGSSYSVDTRLDSGDGPGEFNSFAPAMAARDGLIYVVWHDERNGEGRDIYLNWSSDHGVTWATRAIRVDSDNLGFFDSIYPDVALLDGVAHIAWQDARSSGYDIYYRAATSGVFSVEEQRLDRDSAGFGNSLYPRVAVNGAALVVAWQDRRDDRGGEGYNDLYYNYSLDSGETWNDLDLRIDSIERGSKYAVDLDLWLDGVDLVAVWKDGRRGNADIYFHRLAVGEESEYIVVE